MMTVLLLTLAFIPISGCQKPNLQLPPTTVEVSDVEQKDVPMYFELVSALDGMVNATIRAQVQGYLIRQNYKEGGPVKKDQVLFEIDPRTFQATYSQAKAELAKAEARWNQAKADLARIKPLAAQNAVSKKDLDDAIGTEASAAAAYQSSKAQLEKAALELSFCRITSPIDGIAGFAKTQIGNLVGPGSTEELTTVSQVNPIKAYVSISEQGYLKLLEWKKKNPEETEGKASLELILSDGSIFPHKGEFAFADRQVDERTGTIRVAAIFPNQDSFLRPGQFARIRVKLGTKKNALVIPQRAVKEVQGRYLVGLVGADSKVTIREVKAGLQYGSLWVIDEGLQPGDKVIAEGIQKVKDGMEVKTKPYVEQKNPSAPAGPDGKAQPGSGEKQGEGSSKPNPDKVG